MMKLLAVFFLSLFSMVAHAQKLDTIFVNNQRTIGQVIEISPDFVSYRQFNEQVIYSIDKSRVNKISFGNGRIEKLSNNLNKVTGAPDWEKVDVAMTEAEVKGLHKLGWVSVKATGTTIFSNVSRVQARAIKKLQIATALSGGNVVFLKNEALEGNIRSLRTSRTQFLGSVYSSSSIDTIKFKKFTDDQRYFVLTNKVGLRNNDSSLKEFGTKNEVVWIDSYSISNGIITVNISLQKVEEYYEGPINESTNGLRPLQKKYHSKEIKDLHVVSMNNDKLVLSLKKKTAIYNYVLSPKH